MPIKFQVANGFNKTGTAPGFFFFLLVWWFDAGPLCLAVQFQSVTLENISQLLEIGVNLRCALEFAMFRHENKRGSDLVLPFFFINYSSTYGKPK